MPARSSALRSSAKVAAVALAAATTVACAIAGVPHPAPETTGAPIQTPGAVTLAGWKLTLPVASPKGSAASVDPATFTPPWLTGDGSSGVTLWAPVRGATTPHSGHARTELVNLTSFRAGQNHRRMTASVTVSQVPRARPDVIIGQIHGAMDLSSVAFVMLHYDAGTVDVVVKQADTQAAAHVPLLTGVPLGAPFAFAIGDEGNGRLTFSATHDGRTATADAPVPAFFAGRQVRFQTGAYQQADSAGPAAADDGARVTFHGLTVSS